MGKERRIDCTSPVQEDELSTEGDMQQYHVTGWELRQDLLLLGETGAREAHCLLEAQEIKGKQWWTTRGVKERQSMEKGCPLESGGAGTSLPGGCMGNSRSAVHSDLDGHGRPGKERGQAAGRLHSDTTWSHRCFSLLALGDQRGLKADDPAAPPPTPGEGGPGGRPQTRSQQRANAWHGLAV